ncbi:MAG: amidohydrolase family protein [Gemmatimonadota bacterium]|nr:amidohydrolase family protein [Gemmatimonadota bacterium]
MIEIPFFDANACVGRSRCRTPGSPYDTQGLIDELDYCRITRALVYHAAARELDWRSGNEALLEELGQDKRLVPAAVFNPLGPYTGDRDTAVELERLLEGPFRAFRIFPLYHGIKGGDPELRKTLGVLEERGVPLWLDYDQLYYNFNQLGQHEQRTVDLAEIDSLAADFPDLTLVVVGANFSQHTGLFRVFDRRDNVRVETSLFQGFEMIRFVCRRWGAERLLFGTGLPVVSPGAARAALAYADISDEEKIKIASGNLEALLGEALTPTVPEDDSRSRIMTAVDRGLKLDMLPVLDSHGHIAPEGFDGPIGLTLGPQDACSIVKKLDRIGIDSIAVSSWEILGGDAPGGNRTAWEAVERYPGRFLPLAVVNPNYPEDFPTLIEECFTRRRFFGLKPYPFSQQLPLSSPAYRDALELAQRMRLPVLCHFGFVPLAGAASEEITRLAPLYPDAAFIMAHAGASFRTANALIPLAREFDNVYLEINYTSVPFGMVSYLVREAGAGKVLFGTDTPMRDPAPIVGWVVYDHLTDEERGMILGGNYLRLIRKTGYPGKICS